MRSRIPGGKTHKGSKARCGPNFEEDFKMRFADLELARRLEEAEAVAGVKCTEAVARLHPECRAAVLKVGSGYAAFTGATSPITQAVGLGLRGSVTEAQIKRMEAFYRKRGAAVNIELCPLVDAKLVQLLGRRGYRAIEFSNVLVRPLRRSERFPAPAAGVRVRRMEPGERKLWARTVAQGFAEHMKVTEELLSILEAFSSRSGSNCFFGLVDGQIAGGGVAVIRKRLAVFGGASTLPEVRRRGVQTALQHARLKFAAREGCDLAMTITQPGSTSQRNAERRGFRVVYTRCKLIRKWK
jgi:GNAT superfamily N-acetyltransferase